MPTLESTTSDAVSSDFALARPTRSSIPRNRLKDPADAYTIAHRLIEAAVGRVGKAAVIKSMFDGAPPYPPYNMKSAAQKWRSNFNTLEGESALSNGMTPFYDLMGSMAPLLEIELDTDDARRDEWSRKAATNFSRFFFDYPSLEQAYWQMLYGFVGFNRGFFWWPVPGDPYFRNLPWHRVMFPDATSTDSDEWEIFGVRQNFTVSRLWSMSGGGESPYWTKGAVLCAIARAQPHEPQSDLAEQMDLEQMLRDYDLEISTRSETIKTVSLFVKEFSGKWSWHMVEEDAVTAYCETPPSLRKERPSFMMSALGIFDSANDVIAPFIYEVLDGSINSMGGLGRKILSAMQAKDRMVNSFTDGALMRAYPLFQAQDASALQRGGIVQLGPCHVIPPGLNIVQTNLLADIEGPLAVNEFLNNMVESNTAIFKARLEKPRGNPETATSATLRHQNATVLTSSSVNRFYQQFKRFADRSWAIATDPSGNRPGAKAARKFIERCKEAGVPESVLRKKPLSLEPNRVAGNGSPFMRQQAISNLASFVPFLGPRGKLAYATMGIAAFGGNTMVDKLLPQSDIMDLPSFQDWMADQENGSMKDGMEPPITDGQDHTVHLKKHTSAMAQALQAAQQGGDVMGALAFVQVGLAHSAKHAANLPKDEQKQWDDALNQINRIAAQLMSEVQRQQEEMAKLQQKQQQMSEEAQLKGAKIAAEIALKQQKQDATLSQRGQKFEQDKVLADAATAAGIQREGAATAASIAAQNAETEARIENERLKATAQAEATRAKAAQKPAANKP